MSLMGDPEAPRPPKRRRVNNAIAKLNDERQAKGDEFGALCYELKVHGSLSLRGVREELIRRGKGTFTVQAIDVAWKRYLKRRPCENAVQLRKIELDKLQRDENLLRQYIELESTDGSGRRVLPKLDTLVRVHAELRKITQQRVIITGIAVRPEDTPQFDGAPVTISVVYPESLRGDSDEGRTITVEAAESEPE